MKYELCRLITKFLLWELRRLKREKQTRLDSAIAVTGNDNGKRESNFGDLFLEAHQVPSPATFVVEANPKIASVRRVGAKVESTEETHALPIPFSEKGLKLSTPSQLFPQTFIIESFFACELITILTRGANEEMHFLTGPKIGPIRIVCRWARPPMLERQSPVFVRATARSVADVLIPIIEQGAELHVCAHSHPGAGAGATTPSGTDIECLGRLQRSGSPAVGCIATRDGHLRFFSVSTNFHAMVLGSGVKEITKNVFRIAIKDRH